MSELTTLWLDRAIFNKTATSQRQIPLANPPDPRLEREDQLVWLHHNLTLQRPIEYIARKDMLRRNRIPDANTLVVGNIEFVHAAFTAMKIRPPQIDYYPLCLAAWFRRRLWLDTKEDVCTRIWTSDDPIFVKPADKLKAFTGRVVHSMNCAELEQTNYPRRGKVWCSEPVAFTTEWRVYVVDRQVRHVGVYEGADETAPIPKEEIDTMVAAMVMPNSGWKWKNFVIDVGMVQGQLTLVEAGCGYAMGAYDIKAEDYYALISGFWEEVTKS